jgi:hypothetical protein
VVGDRVAGRDPLDEADEDHQRHAHDREQGDQPPAHLVAEQPGAGAGQEADDDHHRQALEVEVEDRPPRRVAFEDHLFPGAELGRHRGQHIG